MKPLIRFTRRKTTREIAQDNIKAVLKEFTDVYNHHPNYQYNTEDWQAHYDISVKTIATYKENIIAAGIDNFSTKVFVDNVIDHITRLEYIKSDRNQ